MKETYKIGQTVFLKTDTEQKERIVVGILKRADGISYELMQEATATWHYDFEMSPEKNILKTL